MNKIVMYVLAAIWGLVVVLGALLMLVSEPEYKVYDCTTADWHPDIPKEVREHCRNLKLNTPRGITT